MKQNPFHLDVQEGVFYVTEEYLLKKMRAELVTGVVGGFILGLIAGYVAMSLI